MNDKTTQLTSKKNYRANVAAIVLSSSYPYKCEVFIASRTDVPNAWQFPQGGIDKNETPKEALFRELEEEIGTNDIQIIAQYPQWVSYDFPEEVALKMAPFDGQRQRYYLVKLNKGAKININTKNPEFSDFKFVQTKDIYEHVTLYKKNVYKNVLKYFKKEGYI